jgi:hypothetical protein
LGRDQRRERDRSNKRIPLVRKIRPEGDEKKALRTGARSVSTQTSLTANRPMTQVSQIARLASAHQFRLCRCTPKFVSKNFNAALPM